MFLKHGFFLPLPLAAARTFGVPCLQAREISPDDGGEATGEVSGWPVQLAGDAHGPEFYVQEPQNGGRNGVTSHSGS